LQSSQPLPYTFTSTVYRNKVALSEGIYLVPSSLLAGRGLGLVATDVVAERIDHETVAVQVHLVAALGDRLGNLNMIEEKKHGR